MTDRGIRYCRWHFRMWLGGWLLSLGGRIEPEFRSRHEYTEDGETITMWREPA